MKMPSEKQAIHQIARRLAELLNVDQGDVRQEVDGGLNHNGSVLRAGRFTFFVEWKGSGAATPVKTAIELVQHHAGNINGEVIPLVTVPFMGEAGRKLCSEAKVGWLDLSGNARIYARELYILVEGQPNRYKRPGRPSTAFAPKSSRVTRWLLMHPGQAFTQREIARATDMHEGYTSKVVSKLEDDGLIVRLDNGAVMPRDPDLLLEAWSEDYDFSKHNLIQGHVAARSGELLLKQLADALEKAAINYATTGLAAAWLLDRFAGFRIATFYLAQDPEPDFLDRVFFREDPRGANVWFVVPNDEGVFHGPRSQKGIRCVHPVQVYLDLKAHPERAKEAAKRLRGTHLNWRTNG